MVFILRRAPETSGVNESPSVNAKQLNPIGTTFTTLCEYFNSFNLENIYMYDIYGEIFNTPEFCSYGWFSVLCGSI